MVKRFFFLCFLFFLYPIWHLSLHIAYYLDHIFYPNYVDQKNQKRIFLIGNFWSGTTFLQRLLTLNSGYPCLIFWEIYYSPPILQRNILRLGMQINRIIGYPVQKLVDSFEKALSSYSYMHKTGVQAVEEDALVFFPHLVP